MVEEGFSQRRIDPHNLPLFPFLARGSA